MKKKTIKSYFFKHTYKNPSINTLFCFSKRAIKYRKQLNNIKSFNKKTQQSIAVYKFYTNNLIMYNQWLYNKSNVFALFLHSYYTHKNTLTKRLTNLTAFKWQIYIWYLLKNKYNIDLKKALHNYVKTGMLSSHFVHFLSKKNVTYQTRSKYRSKIFNMNPIYYYLYLYSNLLYTYLKVLDCSMYFFTANLSKNRVTVDDSFTTTISNWNYLNSDKNHKVILNLVDYTLNDYRCIINNKNMLDVYFTELDTQKKELLLDTLSKLSSNFVSIIPSSQTLYTQNNFPTDVNSGYLHEFVVIYAYL